MRRHFKPIRSYLDSGAIILRFIASAIRFPLLTALRKFAKPTALQERALKQAARELLLAQSSDWPFILRTNTSPDYAKKRVKAHLLRFNGIYHQLTTKKLNDKWLAEIETRDNLFSEINVNYWA